MIKMELIYQGFNYILSELNYAHRRIRLQNSPLSVNIELTNRCNLYCPMCGNPRMKRKKGDISFDLFRKIIDNIENLRTVKFVSLCQCGESLLHPQFSDMLAYCKGKNFKTNLGTNATLLKGHLAEEIIDNGLDDLSISFDGYHKETYEKMRRNACFEEVKQNIKDFLKLKERKHTSKPRTLIQIITTDDSKQEVEAYCNEWRKTSINCILKKQFNFFAGQLGKGTLASSDLGFHPKESVRYACKMLWTSMIILWDGTVVPCCVDFDGRMKFGDLKKSSIMNVWNNKHYLRLRKMHAKENFNFALCKSCTEWTGARKNKFFPVEKNIYIDWYNYIRKKFSRPVYKLHIWGKD